MGSSDSRHNEVLIDDSPIYRIPISISTIFKSICKIVYKNQIGSGFLIKFFKRNKDFFCLMTNEHIITEEIINQKETITFYYDSESKTKDIDLYSDKRYIKHFKNNIDATVIEILPKDDIPKDYFLIPPIDYMYNFNALLNKEIIVLQYPSGQLGYSSGKIKEIKENEFTHSAGTEYGSSGSPVFLKESLKIIGIHKSGDQKKQENYGDFIGPIFKYFKNFSNDKDDEPMKEPILEIHKIFDSKDEKTKKDADIEKENKEIKNENSLNNNSGNLLNEMTIIYDININKKIINERSKGNEDDSIINEDYSIINEDHSIINEDDTKINENEDKIKVFGDESTINENEDKIKVFGDESIINENEDKIKVFGDESIINENEDKIKIFGDKFVKNNKDNCYLLINGQQYELCEYFELKIIQKENNKLIIKLIETKPITNMSNMFYKCQSLVSLPDISKWDTKNVNNMSNMFYDCESLVSLPDISKWDTKNVTNMSNLFYNCKSLISLPDISKWDTKNVTNMREFLRDCESLKSLPNISKWDTRNVTNMEYMFYSCRLLVSLPDISKWNIANVTNMEYMFGACYSLVSLPDISKWDIQNVTNIGGLFWYCDLLKSLPDISKWVIKKVTNISFLFSFLNH